MTREELKIYLIENKFEIIEKELEQNPQLIRKFFGFLYDPDKAIRNSAAKVFGIAAKYMQEESLKDLIRRMMWMLNDESGSCCWHVPYAIGEIGKEKPYIIESFIPQLEYYAKDPDATLRNGVQEALDVIKNAIKKAPDHD
ncbi:DVU0298 family protein [candidate division KSB1 bacterium]